MSRRAPSASATTTSSSSSSSSGGAKGRLSTSAAQKPAHTRIKIISMGSGGSGKSCLIKRYCEERFVSKYIATIGVDYGVKPATVDGVEVRVNFWDLSGHPEFFEVRNEFYKDAQGAILGKGRVRVKGKGNERIRVRVLMVRAWGQSR